MPAKYHIHSAPVAGRFQAITRSGVVAWEEGCLKCAKCVKKECVYKVYEKRSLDARQMIDSLDSVCQDCFRCVQNCPNRLIGKELNPAYKAIGNSYWSPEILSNIWFQAETGRIPVSGGGYGGPFSGPGFDAMWTDMSEIVRPTRDGIHGREYISTTLDLGRKPMFLAFDPQGELVQEPPPLLELPLPVVLSEPPLGADKPRLRQIIAQAAQSLGTLAIFPRESITAELTAAASSLVPCYAKGPDPDDPLLPQLRALELADHPGVMGQLEALKRRFPQLIVWIKVPANEAAADRVAALSAAGAEVLHLAGSDHGRGLGGVQDLYLKDLIRRCHLRLVEEKLRDAVTIMAGGGIALAEHVAKAIVCGTDGVIADLPLLLSLECRMCKQCGNDNPCPVDLEHLNVKRGAQRMVNLIGAWNNQLLEILGAMGMREVRRLRGEVGRAMFKEDLDREIFAPLFARPEGEARRVGE
jgi:ferredoxin